MITKKVTHLFANKSTSSAKSKGITRIYKDTASLVAKIINKKLRFGVFLLSGRTNSLRRSPSNILRALGFRS